MYFQSGCPDISSVFGVATIFFKRIETYNNSNISTLHPRVLDLVFLDWHSFNKYRSNFGEVDGTPAKNDKVNKVEK